MTANPHTLTIEDPSNLLSEAVKADIRRCAQFAIDVVGRYVKWQGTMDFTVRIRPGSENTAAGADGLLPSVAQISFRDGQWSNGTLIEAITGKDADTRQADAGCFIFLGRDGTVRNYGAPVWFDPNPSLDAAPNVPAGQHDFIGIYIHEVFHSLGFYGITRQWKSMVEQKDGLFYFTGPKTKALLGGEPLLLAPAYSADNFPDHYGNDQAPNHNISRGLLWQYGNYERNRLDIGRIDLAILEDLGHAVVVDDRLALFELVDSRPHVDGTPASEMIYGDYQGNRLRGLAGNDTIIAGPGDDVLTGGAGDDRLEGGAGIDIADYAGAAARYRLVLSRDGAAVIDPSAAEGTDTLVQIERLRFADKFIAIESRTGGRFDDLPASLYQFFILAFDAAPGQEFLQQCADAFRGGADVRLITNVFTSKSQFTDVYPPSLPHRDLAQRLIENVVGNSASEASKSQAVKDITQAMDNGLGVGNMIFTVFTNLAARPLSGDEWSGTARLFQNQIAVAKYYSETLCQSTTDLLTLRSAIAAVTPESDVSTEAALATLIGQGLLGG